jgi:hypothetical protein
MTEVYTANHSNIHVQGFQQQIQQILNHLTDKLITSFIDSLDEVPPQQDTTPPQPRQPTPQEVSTFSPPPGLHMTTSKAPTPTQTTATLTEGFPSKPPGMPPMKPCKKVQQPPSRPLTPQSHPTPPQSNPHQIFLQPTPKLTPTPPTTPPPTVRTPTQPPVFYPSTDINNNHYTGETPAPWLFTKPTLAYEQFTAKTDALPKHQQPVGWGHSTSPATPHAHFTPLTLQESYHIYNNPIPIIANNPLGDLDPNLYADIILEQTIHHEHFPEHTSHRSTSSTPQITTSFRPLPPPRTVPRTPTPPPSQRNTSSSRRISTFSRSNQNQ